jgi:hypothetical protein
MTISFKRETIIDHSKVRSEKPFVLLSDPMKSFATIGAAKAYITRLERLEYVECYARSKGASLVDPVKAAFYQGAGSKTLTTIYVNAIGEIMKGLPFKGQIYFNAAHKTLLEHKLNCDRYIRKAIVHNRFD